jgi:hypothetical protein
MLNQLRANNPVTMLQQFAQFKQSMAGKDPESMVNELLRSGKMSPAQFEQLKQQAQTFMKLLG